MTPRREALHRLPVPVAFYKDANIRNFLLTDDGVAIIDFDDLTLAPFGYDLAKLVVSAPERLRVYAEFHHLLTERYLHRNGYSHAWPEVRPWREPEVPR